MYPTPTPPTPPKNDTSDKPWTLLSFLGMDPGIMVLLAPSLGFGRTGDSVNGRIQAMVAHEQVSLRDFFLLCHHQH